MSRVRAPGAARESAALAPVREALLAAARHDAEQTLTRANETAARLLAQAQAQADQIRTGARARGAADSAEHVAAQRSRAGRQARAMVLAAQREEYEALRSAACQAGSELTADAFYPAVRQRMIEALRALLGDAAQIRDMPGGGVSASVPNLNALASRPVSSADFSLARLAERAADTVLAEADESTDLASTGDRPVGAGVGA
ncbi:MAG TPA: hypothetical protein VH561_05705 [Micromonosporaceae bacterium]|jgi:vacuolar-type H+-ATPase subunit E/Vma4